jgi:hypothetical protein
LYPISINGLTTLDYLARILEDNKMSKVEAFDT